MDNNTMIPKLDERRVDDIEGVIAVLSELSATVKAMNDTVHVMARAMKLRQNDLNDLAESISLLLTDVSAIKRQLGEHKVEAKAQAVLPLAPPRLQMNAAQRKSFPKRLRFSIALRGKDMKSTGVGIGLGPTVVSRWCASESMPASQETLDKLARYLRVDPEWLAGLTGEDTSIMEVK